jgi:polysaccharide export outer membrane protein
MPKSRESLCLVVLFAIVSAASMLRAQTAPNAPSQANQIPPIERSAVNAPDVRIGTGDLLQVGIFGVPEFTQEVRVNGQGKVSLPPLDLIQVAGLSTSEAESQIRDSLVTGEYFKDPRVSVFVKEYASQGVSVLGEVNKPGVYPALGARKFFDLISAAGGLTAKAGDFATITRRESGEAVVRLPITRDAENSPATNADVHPGDTIIVSTAPVVYVLGEVGKPGGFVMDRGRLTVLQAVAMAGGVSRTASLKGATLIRRNGGNQEIPINQILQAKAADLSLVGDDILFIPNSAAKSAGRRTLEAIIQAATGVAIYSTPRRDIEE